MPVVCFTLPRLLHFIVTSRGVRLCLCLSEDSKTFRNNFNSVQMPETKYIQNSTPFWGSSTFTIVVDRCDGASNRILFSPTEKKEKFPDLRLAIIKLAPHPLCARLWERCAVIWASFSLSYCCFWCLVISNHQLFISLFLLNLVRTHAHSAHTHTHPTI